MEICWRSAWSQLTAPYAWQSDMQSLLEANRKMLANVIAMDETFLLG